MTEINIADLVNYDKESVRSYLRIINKKKFKILIPRNRIEVEPVKFTGTVEYNAAAYGGHLLSYVASCFAYYVPCPVSTDPFYFIVNIRNITAFSELLYVLAQVFISSTPQKDIVNKFFDEENDFFYNDSVESEICRTGGLSEMADRLVDPFEDYCVFTVKERACLNIADFWQYNNTALYAHLLKLKTNHFEIIIPRQAKQDLVMFDYIDAAYAGQLLSETASHFAYFVPEARSKQPFCFHLTVHNLEEFTDTLHLVIHGLNYRVHNDDEFTIKASEFLAEAKSDDHDCKTWGLLHLALKLMCEL